MGVGEDGKDARDDRERCEQAAQLGTRAPETAVSPSTRTSAAPARAGRSHRGGAAPAATASSAGKGPVAVAAGALALVIYGLLVAQQPSNDFGRVLAAYGGVFVIGSMFWAVAFDGFKPDRFDLLRMIVCLLGIGVTMYAPR
jgi:small multidrug resistance family-3 protein